jgi:uncharacterized protein YgiM (DUF1202 family)
MAPETTTVPAPPLPVAEPPRAAPRESTRVVPAPVKRPAKDSTPQNSDTARSVKDTTQPVKPAAAPEPVSIDPAHQRYAQDWVKLRAEPSNTAAVLRVLEPGEIVTVDSLQDGWYRVVLDQQVGYVDRQYLDTLRPR